MSLGQVVNDSISQFQWKFYHVSVPGNGGLLFSLNQSASNTDCDLYIQKDDFPTFSSYVARDISMNSAVTLNITVPRQRARPSSAQNAHLPSSFY